MDSRLIKPRALPKPLLLKDYLLDDMSSCSSNGFKSFPRRRCCTTTVRFLIEIDLKNKQSQKKCLNISKNPPGLLKSPSKSAALSTFKSVISAVKRIPFGGACLQDKSKPKKSILPRNLSKKIIKKSTFWKRKSSRKEIDRWKPFDQILEDSTPLDDSDTSVIEGKSKNWSETIFPISDDSSNGNSSTGVDSNVPDVRNDAVEVIPENINGPTTTSSDSSASTNSSSKR